MLFLVQRSHFALTLAMVAFAFSATSLARGPNIIYVLADDMGYGDLGCYGGQLPTPNIDQFAAEGMRFTQHYAGCTVCAPSRCVLITGMHTGHCRVRGNSPGLMLDRDVTIAELLQEAGYATGCAGKWGIGSPPPLDDPAANGFDSFYGYISMWHAHNFYPEFMIRNGREVPLRNKGMPQWKDSDGRGVAMVRRDYAPDFVTAEALRFVQQNHQRPFFLYWALNVPHANNEAGRASDREEKGMEVPTFGEFSSKQWPGPEKGFAAMLHNIDRDFGKLMRQLKQLDIDDNTLVIFSSDNGPHQEGGHKADFFNSSGPLRGKKRDLYEGGIRVPMIARWPKVIASGTTSELVSSFTDMLPTFCDAAAKKIDHGVDGVSLLPTLRGEVGRQQQHAFLYWEFSEQGGKRAIRKDDWKLIQRNVSKSKPAPPELYNLSQDLGESKDLASENPEVVKQLTKLMDAAHEPSNRYPLFATERSK